MKYNQYIYYYSILYVLYLLLCKEENYVQVNVNYIIIKYNVY